MGAVMEVCQGCGSGFSRKRRGNDARKYCSRECAFAHAKQWLTGRPKKPKPEPKSPTLQSCIRCGQEAGMSYSPMYCSQRCRWEARKERHPGLLQRIAAGHREKYGADLTPRPCKECEAVFTPKHGGQKKFCSKQCLKRCMARQARRKKPRNSMFRARARRYRVAYTPGITWRAVMQRDGDTCSLCGFAVPPISSRSDPLSPTVDHRVPMAGGGGHTWENVQLAHRICNSYKCAGKDLPDRAIEPLLRLHGVVDQIAV